MCFHTANAWEEGGKIRLFLCTFNSFRCGVRCCGAGAKRTAGTGTCQAGCPWFERRSSCACRAHPARSTPPRPIPSPVSLDTLRLEPDSEPFISEVAIDLEAGTAERRRLTGALPGDFPCRAPQPGR